MLPPFLGPGPKMPPNGDEAMAHALGGLYASRAYEGQGGRAGRQAAWSDSSQHAGRMLASRQAHRQAAGRQAGRQVKQAGRQQAGAGIGQVVTGVKAGWAMSSGQRPD